MIDLHSEVQPLLYTVHPTNDGGTVIELLADPSIIINAPYIARTSDDAAVAAIQHALEAHGHTAGRPGLSFQHVSILRGRDYEHPRLRIVELEGEPTRSPAWVYTYEEDSEYVGYKRVLSTMRNYAYAEFFTEASAVKDCLSTQAEYRLHLYGRAVSAEFLQRVTADAGIEKLKRLPQPLLYTAIPDVAGDGLGMHLTMLGEPKFTCRLPPNIMSEDREAQDVVRAMLLANGYSGTLPKVVMVRHRWPGPILHPAIHVTELPGALDSDGVPLQGFVYMSALCRYHVIGVTEIYYDVSAESADDAAKQCVRDHENYRKLFYGELVPAWLYKEAIAGLDAALDRMHRAPPPKRTAPKPEEAQQAVPKRKQAAQQYISDAQLTDYIAHLAGHVTMHPAFHTSAVFSGEHENKLVSEVVITCHHIDAAVELRKLRAAGDTRISMSLSSAEEVCGPPALRATTAIGDILYAERIRAITKLSRVPLSPHQTRLLEALKVYTAWRFNSEEEDQKDVNDAKKEE